MKEEKEMKFIVETIFFLLLLENIESLEKCHFYSINNIVKIW